jgi:SAM-dependent methyltransferase
MAVNLRERRFDFGGNWLDFARGIDAERLVEAEKSIGRLVGLNDLAGLNFVDIGCGSGLFSLAARRLGSRVVSFDADENAVLCTRRLRDQYHPADRDWIIERGSVLDPVFLRSLGSFDVVYSWGVLHHTGAMRQAIAAAAGLVMPGGLFALALYYRTILCSLWRMEKRWYAAASPAAQKRARAIYVALLQLAHFANASDFRAYVANYVHKRGMSFIHDVHDWMGGYPYESISAAEIDAVMSSLGFARVRGGTVTLLTTGLFGSGCNEYLFQRCPSGG